MSIVELSKSVDALAKKITQKNRELEDLKKGYDAKLVQINKYINRLRKEFITGAGESTGGKDVISDEKFIETINTSIRCNTCDKELWNLDEKSDFILIPKKKLKYLLETSKGIELEDKINKLNLASSEDMKISDSNSAIRQNSKQQTSNGYRNTKSKKVCSYCKNTGHSRAKCLKRLNTPSE